MKEHLITAKQESALLEEIETIREKNGKVTPELVVEFAKDKKTALHGRFEWDETKAAAAYRIEQARRVLRVFVKLEDGENGNPVKVRAFISLPSDRKIGNEYRTIEDVLKNPEWRSEMLDMAKKELKSFKEKYRAFSELAGIHEEIDKLTS